jgi:hypothetical protein
MAAQTLNSATIAQLKATLAAAESALSADKAKALEPYISELIARNPIARSKKPETLWFGTNETVHVTVEGVEYRVSVVVTDVAQTDALKKASK